MTSESPYASPDTPGSFAFRDGDLATQPVLYRTAGKQVLEGTKHYADARDEVAAAIIAKALNGGGR